MVRLTEIDGNDFYYAFLAGSAGIMKNQVFMNKINVFPVPDGDTGSNLASTMRYIIEQTAPDISFKKTADSIASAALEGARGNSGIIFAQFLYGISRKVSEESTINVKRFARAVKSALQYAVSAIEKPVEGTVITVLRDWVNHVDDLKEKIDDFFQLVTESLKKARKSLLETPLKLEILKKHNVVDAGAQGFVFFLEGVLDFLKEGNLRKILRLRTAKIEPVKEHHSFSDIQFRYCTEAVIERSGTKGPTLDKQIIKDIIGEMGDSLVIAGPGEKMRIHIHTNDPADFFYRLKDVGFISFPRVDDMIRQHETAYQRKWSIALVTDSVCDLPAEVMDRYQVHMVPINIHFGKSSFLDKRSITPDQFYRMLREEKEFPTTSQAGLQDFLNLYNYLVTYYDSVIAVHMSKQLSGTWNASYNAARKVEEETGKKITVIDSRHLSGTLGLMVLRAAEAIANGMSHDDIAAAVDRWADQSSILVSVKTLKYMVKGGRVSPMKGWLANVLNLKPIVSVDAEGKSVLYDRAFSQKGNMKKVTKIVQRKMQGRLLWRYSVLHAHDPESAAWYAEKLTGVFNRGPDFIIDISPAVGKNAGHGAVAVSFMFD
jgi:DegV family protein with EDD domain